MTEVTLDKLRVISGTACSHIVGSGTARETTYRLGNATELGDIERSLWGELAEAAICRDLGEQMLPNMEAFLATHAPKSLRESPDALHIEALQNCVERSFDNPKWKWYIQFNKEYRPDALGSAKQH